MFTVVNKAWVKSKDLSYRECKSKIIAKSSIGQITKVPFYEHNLPFQDPEAQYFLGVCYEQGWGVEVNECKSAELYSQAAASGHDGALYSLAVFHEQALGGNKFNHRSFMNMFLEVISSITFQHNTVSVIILCLHTYYSVHFYNFLMLTGLGCIMLCLQNTSDI